MERPLWRAAPLPENESDRLAELHSYQILDTAPDIVFDRLVHLASRLFDMPIAVISLIDKDRQWFKARIGIEEEGTSRDVAFCTYTLLQDGVMVVPDVNADPRFAGNPRIVIKENIHFYAAAPLITKNGFKLGVICLLDHKPHPDFSKEDEKNLAEIAAITVDEMELHLSIKRAQQDLEALRNTQKELEVARQKAERTTHEKTQFVATISHELRTPMNGILGMAYLLGDTPLNKIQREYIDTINHSAQNLLLLINDVLDLSKIEAGELILEKKRFDIINSFTQTIKLMKPLAHKKGNALVCQIDDSVPYTIIGDQGRFTQILTNLVGNAVKFTEDGRVDVTLRYDEDNNCIHCSVKDTGIGIPESKHSSIFEKFTQGDASITQKYGGTGLGLAITKHLVVMLGGTIGFESKEKVGSHFWFTLPVAKNENMALASSANKFGAKPGLIDVRQAHVLVAEDHPVNQLFLVALLKKFGFSKVDVAENGVEVMETIRRNSYGYRGKPYDAIFMDCKMPEQDGHETTRMIREQEQQMGTAVHIPIIAMTANALAGDREDCFASGMDEYLSKPLQPDRVKDVLSQWFSFPSGAEEIVSIQQPTDKTPPMDFARLQMVAETDSEKTVLLEIFFKLAKDIVSTMEDARRGEEFTQWKNAAHKLKGAAANMGMMELENLCRDSERASDSTYSQRSALLRSIKDEIAHIRTYIVEQSPTLLPLDDLI